MSRARQLDRLVVRLVLVALAAGVGAAVVGTALLASSARATLREDVNRQHEDLAVDVANRTDARIESVVSALRVVATRQSVGSVPSQSATDLAAVLRASEFFDEIVLRDTSGAVVAAAASRFLATPDDYGPDSRIAREAADGLLIRLDADTPGALEMAVPVESPPGNVVGTLIASAPLEVLLHGVFRAPNEGEPLRYLIERGGTVLVHPNRDLVVNGERVDLSSLGELPAGELVRDESDVLRAAAPITSFGAVVVVERDEDVALAPVDERISELVIILVVVLGSAVVAISVAGGYLLRPLTPLAHSIAQLGRGQRGMRVESAGSGEVATLTGEFNRLADALERREQEVEELQRVSLLLHGHVARHDVVSEIVAGATAVLEAKEAVLWEANDGTVIPQGVSEGDTLATQAVARELAAAAAQVTTPQVSAADQSIAAFPVRGLDQSPSGVLVVTRTKPWDERGLQMGDALAAVAGVAIENVRRLELERQLAEELQAAADRRRDFMGTVTHEFRTPLTCIEGFSSLLLEQWDAQDDLERRRLVEKIHRHSEELDELVSRLLDFAVTERGTLRAELSTVSLAPLIEEVAVQLAPLLAGRPLERDIAEVAVAADPVLLRRTLTNLLSNAVKYSAPGTEIFIRTEVHDATVAVEVADRGVGMSADEVASAFTPFWRAGNSSTRGSRGAGIGLSLVAEYVRSMGGSIEVRSEPGEGSVFCFTLRRAEEA